MNLMSLKTIRIVLMFSLPVLAACGGGGGGDGGGGTTDTTTATALTFQPLVGVGSSNVVMEIYNKDLNGDGIDEVIIAGRKSGVGDGWQNFNIQIFGWNNSTTLANETSTWFSGTDNVIIGTDQAVKFADFDGDGRVDMLTTSSTDNSTVYAQTIVYHQKTSGVFTRSVVTTQADALWSHDLAIYDFNNDGRMDFIASDYGSKTTMGFGNLDGTFTLHTSGNGSHGASGIAVADFISNGTQYGANSVEIVMSDSGTNNGDTDDTSLFTWSVVDPTVAGTLTLTSTGTFAADTNTTAPNDHTVRVLAFDYDNDSDMDVIAFSRSLGQDGTSVVDFMANDGAGNFTSAAVVSNFSGDELGVNYQPVLIDVDGDSDLDIFLSGEDYNGDYNSTQVLINDAGTFTGTYTTNFASNWNAKFAATADKAGSGQSQQIVKGTSSNYYIVTTVYYDIYTNGVATKHVAVHTTNIGTTISTGLSNM